jgi:hypothetical protein
MKRYLFYTIFNLFVLILCGYPFFKVLIFSDYKFWAYELAGLGWLFDDIQKYIFFRFFFTFDLWDNFLLKKKFLYKELFPSHRFDLMSEISFPKPMRHWKQKIFNHKLYLIKLDNLFFLKNDFFFRIDKYFNINSIIVIFFMIIIYIRIFFLKRTKLSSNPYDNLLFFFFFKKKYLKKNNNKIKIKNLNFNEINNFNYFKDNKKKNIRYYNIKNLNITYDYIDIKEKLKNSTQINFEKLYLEYKISKQNNFNIGNQYYDYYHNKIISVNFYKFLLFLFFLIIIYYYYFEFYINIKIFIIFIYKYIFL